MSIMPATERTCQDDPWQREKPNFEIYHDEAKKFRFEYILNRMKLQEDTARQLMLIDATVIGLFMAFATNSLSFSTLSSTVKIYFGILRELESFMQFQKLVPIALASLTIIPIIMLIKSLNLSLNILNKELEQKSWHDFDERISQLVEKKERLLNRSCSLTFWGVSILVFLFICIYFISVYDNAMFGSGVGNLIIKGNILNNEKNYEKALEQFDEAIKINPINAPAWEGRAEALGGLGSYNESIQAFNTALIIDPNNSAAWTNKGLVLEKLGKNKLAIEHFRKAISIERRSSAAWINLGKNFLDQGNIDAAIEANDNATKIDPGNVIAWNNKGYALLLAGRYNESIEAYDNATDRNQKFALAWTSKGYCYLNISNYNKSLEALNIATDINPNNANAWYYKAKVFTALGRSNESVRAYEIALELDNSLINSQAKGDYF